MQLNNLIWPPWFGPPQRKGKPRRNSAVPGQGLVEYALILVLVAVVTIVIVGLLGNQVQNVFCDVLLGLGDQAPQVAACEAPRVSCVGVGNGATVTSPIILEAIVSDNNGPSAINRVEFYVDSSLLRTEYYYQYCLGGTDDCSGAPQNLSPGAHTIEAVAYDTDGYSGTCSISITVTS